jgi:hypothetical protein
MDTKIKLSDVKKIYTGNAEEVQRGFLASLRRLQEDASAAEAENWLKVQALAVKAAEEAQQKAEAHSKEVKGSSASAEVKEAAKKEAEEARKRTSEARAVLKQMQKEADAAKQRSISAGIKPESLQALAEVMQRKGLRAEDIKKDFLLQYIPERFNESQQLCSVKEVKPEEAEEVRKQFEDTPEVLVQKDEKLFIYKQQRLFTSNTFVTLFTSAADKRAKMQKEAADKRSEAEKAADKKKKEEARAKKFEELRKRLAEYDAEQAAKKAEEVQQ